LAAGPSGVLWPKQTFLPKTKKKYHYSAKSGFFPAMMADRPMPVKCHFKEKMFILKSQESQPDRTTGFLDLFNQLFGDFPIWDS
jgi:hypothetical protein